jgi:hypothetical protein
MYKFRASQIGQLMTAGRSKSEEFGATALSLMREVWIAQKYGRYKDISNKYLEKGNECEEASISLFQEWEQHKNLYTKNEQTITNDWITGTPDLFNKTEVIDIKSSWDIFTFTAADGSDKGYYWQLQAYMALLGVESARLVYCLVSAPEWMVTKEKTRLYYSLGGDDMGGAVQALYKRKAEQLERNMIYDDIPVSERVKAFTFERSNDDIAAMFSRVDRAREIMRGW